MKSEWEECPNCGDLENQRDRLEERIIELERQLAEANEKHANAITAAKAFSSNRDKEWLRAEKAEAEREAAVMRNARLRAALEAYPEWVDDDNGDSIGTMQRFVTCMVCEGGGAFNGDGKPSKRMPPTHKPDCARQAALSPKTPAAEGEAKK